MSKLEYWHNIKTEKERKKILEDFASKKKTLKDLMLQFKQPAWCKYHEALACRMGCWSLFYTPWEIKKNCPTCELSKHYKKEKAT